MDWVVISGSAQVWNIWNLLYAYNLKQTRTNKYNLVCILIRYKPSMLAFFRVFLHSTSIAHRIGSLRLSTNHLRSRSRIFVFSHQWPQQDRARGIRKTLSDELFRIWCRSVQSKGFVTIRYCLTCQKAFSDCWEFIGIEKHVYKLIWTINYQAQKGLIFEVLFASLDNET